MKRFSRKENSALHCETKLKINVNLPQMLYFVAFAAQNGEFEPDLKGYAMVMTRGELSSSLLLVLQRVTVNAEPFKSLN